MTSPYRESAEPLVVCRPKRTLLGRLRSWWRRRFVVGRATWRFRFRRLPCGHRDVQRRPFIGGAWIWQPPPERCRVCEASFTAEQIDPAGFELGTFRFRLQELSGLSEEHERRVEEYEQRLEDERRKLDELRDRLEK